MSNDKENLGFLYINGLDNGATTLKDRVVKAWWQRAALDMRHAHINWYDGAPLAKKIDSVEKKLARCCVLSTGSLLLVRAPVPV